MDPLGLLSDDSDASDDDKEEAKQAEEAANAAKRKKMDFETLCKAGYKGCAPHTTRTPADVLWIRESAPREFALVVSS